MSQKIKIEGLRVFGYHGVLDFEREEGQYFVVDATLTVDHDRAVKSDDIANTVSYAEVAELIAKNVKNNPVNLLETLAQRLADEVLIAGAPYLKKVKIAVSKPDAPIQLYFDNVKVIAKARKS